MERFAISLFNCYSGKHIYNSTIYLLSQHIEPGTLEYMDGKYVLNGHVGSDDLFGFDPLEPRFTAEKRPLYTYINFDKLTITQPNIDICCRLERACFGYVNDIAAWLCTRVSNIELATWAAQYTETKVTTKSAYDTFKITSLPITKPFDWNGYIDDNGNLYLGFSKSLTFSKL